LNQIKTVKSADTAYILHLESLSQISHIAEGLILNQNSYSLLYDFDTFICREDFLNHFPANLRESKWCAVWNNY